MTKKFLTCGCCKKSLPRNHFHAKTSSKTGKQSYCKVCNQKATTRWDAENPEKVRERRRRHNDNYDKAKRRASIMVRSLIRKGKLIPQPCEVCGSTSRINGHHDDYSNPTDVRWLCHRCHCAHHAELRAIERSVKKEMGHEE